MSSIDVDSCVVAKWFFAAPDSDQAMKLPGEGIDLMAPDFILVELGNILWKCVRSGRISDLHALSRLSIASQYFAQLRISSLLLDETFNAARQGNHPFCDCLYVVAARASNAPLVTSDNKLVAKLAGTPDARNVIVLADWKP